MIRAYLVPYSAALVIGVTAGTIAGSPVVVGLAALAAASLWAAIARRVGAR